MASAALKWLLLLLVIVFVCVDAFLIPAKVSSFPRLHATQQRSNERKGFNLLELGIPGGQGLLVTLAKWGWSFIYNRLLVELAPQDENGAYARTGYNIKSGNLGDENFPIEQGRYHIYVGNPCPWCHRVQLAHTLYGLQDIISMSLVADDPTKARRGGWYFSDDKKDPIWNEPDLLAVYNRCNPVDKNEQFVGRCTLPLLIDTKTQTIVSNESKDIVRMLRAASRGPDLASDDLHDAMDNLQSFVYEKINNGVYRCGFSSKQAAYDEAVKDVFEGFFMIDEALAKTKFLHGDKVTETDIFLLPTVVRFDAIYHQFFKCGLTTIESSYPNIKRWMEDMHVIPGIRKCFDLNDAKRSYHKQLFPLNPSGIVYATQERNYLNMLDRIVEDKEASKNSIDLNVKFL